MDPVANVREQIELARRIQELIDTHADENGRLPDDVAQEIADDANRLAELIEALHSWRSKGGFDPYSPDARDPGWQAPGEIREHVITLNIREPEDVGAGYITAEWATDLPWEEMLDLPNVSMTVNYERKENQ